MATIVLHKELRLLDLVNDVYMFYNIQVMSVGYNELHVIFHSGKAGTKGSKTMKTTKSYKEAMALAYVKFHEKKAKGYEEREDLKGWLGQTDTSDNTKKPEALDKPKKKSNSASNTDSSHHCDDCKKSIDKDVYDEINKWGRGGGGWDKDKNFIGYNKVLCIKCQWKHDIFKKRL